MSELKGVNVTVVSAHNLLNTDATWLNPSDKSDPYVIVKVGAKSQQTKILQNDLNPIWNETFHFDCSWNDIIEFQVWDEDKLQRDDALGSAKVTLSELQLSVGPHNLELQLSDSKGVIANSKLVVTISTEVIEHEPSRTVEEFETFAPKDDDFDAPSSFTNPNPPATTNDGLFDSFGVDSTPAPFDHKIDAFDSAPQESSPVSLPTTSAVPLPTHQEDETDPFDSYSAPQVTAPTTVNVNKDDDDFFGTTEAPTQSRDLSDDTFDDPKHHNGPSVETPLPVPQAVASVAMPEEEPAKPVELPPLTKWEISNREDIARRDEEEKSKLDAIKKEANNVIDRLEKEREDLTQSKRSRNVNAEAEFCKQRDALFSHGDVWERVVSLIDVKGSNDKQSQNKSTNRMRQLLLRLKNERKA